MTFASYGANLGNGFHINRKRCNMFYRIVHFDLGIRNAIDQLLEIPKRPGSGADTIY
ncbi:hypothetical protein CLV58_12224 [Spirosoma oryzae]|uniref:Uncharacterized protein n=1 Tax=Spirosoma oryzae TaxID=1469603 RepID=A0A2T0SE78_9BACT|nr:hypothetical protein CLV58_12224 [Spirosoma oryzae]